MAEADLMPITKFVPLVAQSLLKCIFSCPMLSCGSTLDKTPMYLPFPLSNTNQFAMNNTLFLTKCICFLYSTLDIHTFIVHGPHTLF